MKRRPYLGTTLTRFDRTPLLVPRSCISYIPGITRHPSNVNFARETNVHDNSARVRPGSSAGTPCDGDQNWAMYDSLPIDAASPFTGIRSGTLIVLIVFDLALLDAVETLMGTVGLYLPGYGDPGSISMLNAVAASLPQSVVPHSGSS